MWSTSYYAVGAERERSISEDLFLKSFLQLHFLKKLSCNSTSLCFYREQIFFVRIFNYRKWNKLITHISDWKCCSWNIIKSTRDGKLEICRNNKRFGIYSMIALENDWIIVLLGNHSVTQFTNLFYANQLLLIVIYFFETNLAYERANPCLGNVLKLDTLWPAHTSLWKRV